MPSGTSLGIFNDVTIEVEFSEPVKNIINPTITSNISGNVNFTHSLDGDTTLLINLKAPLISKDKLQLKIQNISDLAGQTSPDYSADYNVKLLADFNDNGDIGVDDFNNFILGWENKDSQYEIGPVNGSAPYFLPELDGIFNLRDGMTFYRMWHWSQGGAGKMMAKVLYPTGQEVNVSFDNNNIIFHAPMGAHASEIIINYPATNIQISPRNEGNIGQLPMGLSKVDTLLGQMLTHQILNEDKSISFDLNHYTKNDVTITFSYQYIDKDNKVISEGSRDFVLKPVPEEFALHQNYPNPFNPITTIHYDLPEASHVNFVIYDILGRKVIDLVGKEVSSGYQTITWNGRNMMGNPVSAGIYFYQIQAKDFLKVRKMILLK